MKDQFPGYYVPDDAAFNRLWNEAKIVLDANVLLEAFRYSSTTSAELLAVLRQLGDRVWLPYHAAWEYHDNLPGVLGEQARSYEQAIADADKLFSQLASDTRHPFVGPELMDRLNAILPDLKGELNNGYAQMKSLLTKNPLKDDIASLFSGKVGPGFSKDELAPIYREGAERYAASIPPGYKDKDKPEPRRYGDLVVWKELLRMAATEKVPVIFVTSDTKEDWFLISMGLTLGPRPELVKEFVEVASGPFHAYPTERFLSHARDHLQAKVSEKSLAEIKSVRHELAANVSALSRALADLDARSAAVIDASALREFTRQAMANRDTFAEYEARRRAFTDYLNQQSHWADLLSSFGVPRHKQDTTESPAGHDRDARASEPDAEDDEQSG